MLEIGSIKGKSGPSRLPEGINTSLIFKTTFLLVATLSYLVRLRLTWRTDTRNFSLSDFRIVSDAGNFDLASWFIVINNFDLGLNPWDSNRYNYGPSWGLVLFLMHKISGDDLFQVRFLIVLILFLVDVGIAILLLKFKRRIAALIYLLNPISLIISGYHNQIESFAIFFSLFGIYVLAINYKSNSVLQTKYVILASILLGIGLTFKHTFFILPLWLAFRNSNFTHKFIFISLPYTMFLISFAPYWSSSSSSIIRNVFQYRSYQNFPLYTNIFDLALLNTQYLYFVFLSMILTLGWILRHSDLLNSFGLLSISIVALAPSIANQYLSIATLGAILIPSALHYLFLLFGSIYLVKNPDGLGLSQVKAFGITPSFLSLILFLGVCQQLEWIRKVSRDKKEKQFVYRT